MNNKHLSHAGILLLLLVNGLSAVISGLLFIKAPDGSLMRISTAVLAFSPFDNFLIPGIILLIFNGILSLFVLWQVAGRKQAAGYWLVLQGLLSTGWILVQVILLRSFQLLHFIFGMTGLLFLLAGMQYLKYRKQQGQAGGKQDKTR